MGSIDTNYTESIKADQVLTTIDTIIWTQFNRTYQRRPSTSFNRLFYWLQHRMHKKHGCTTSAIKKKIGNHKRYWGNMTHVQKNNIWMVVLAITKVSILKHGGNLVLTWTNPSKL